MSSISEAKENPLPGDLSLVKIFDHWSVDKGQCHPGPGGKAEFHGYAGLYECLFRHDREEIQTVLEIGIGTMRPAVHSSMVGWALPGYRSWATHFAAGESISNMQKFLELTYSMILNSRMTA